MEATEERSPERREILVVDDNPESLKLLSQLLSSQGYRVRPALGGELALRSAAAKAPDLVLLDVKMPGMDGVEVCRRLKADAKTRNVPVLFISASGERLYKTKGFEAGAVDYITKPFDAEEVYARIKTHLRIRDLTELLEQRVAERTVALSDANKRLQDELEIRARTEASLRDLNRRLKAISECNQVLMRAEDEQLLLNKICSIVCEEAGYRMAWVGFAENDSAKSVRTTSWAGTENGYLKTISLSWDENSPRGQGPGGTCIRSGQLVCVQDFVNDPKAKPWRDEAIRCGYLSCVSLPLKDDGGRTFGCISIYSGRLNAFTDEEIWLLKELVGDLAFGIVSIRARKERAKAEAELKLSSERLAEKNRMLEEAVARAKELAVKAEAANKAKSEFLANISHELRTPMNAVIGFSELLLETKLSSEQREFVDIIMSRGNDLISIIRDILDLTKLEAGMLSLADEDYDLLEIVNESLQTIQFLAKEKSLSINSKVNSDVPQILYGDGLRVKQVLVNLLGNAVKFTSPSGRIEIEVSRLPGEGERPQEIQFQVRDTGIGIPERMRESIFDPFVQVDGSHTRRFGGAGLGLAICQRLVKRMGGRIWVESELGNGSTFAFSIPCAASSILEEKKEEKGPGGSGKPGGLPGGLRMLVVEDDPMSSHLLQQMLSQEAAVFTLATTGAAALKEVASKPFDLIFMDIQLPETNGVDLAVAIRKLESSGSLPGGGGERRLGRIPIIAFTALGSKGDVERFIDAGMDDCLLKPVHKSQVVEIMLKHLGSLS